MKNKIFWIAFCMVTICAIAVGAGINRSKQGKSLGDDVTQAIKDFQNPNPMRRGDAFYRLIEISLGGELQGRTYLIPDALSRLFPKLPNKADELKIALVELLERENSFIQEHVDKHERSGSALGEEYTNYKGDLIAAVAGLQDIRALNGLLGVISTGNMATNGLAALGDEAVDPVIQRLNSGDPSSRRGAVGVLSKMLRLEKIEAPASKVKIKRELMIAARDERWALRMAAVEGLEMFDDPEVVALLEETAKSDPRGKPGFFPVREAAEKALRRIKSARKNK